MPEFGNLFEQQESNRRRSVWLIVGFVLFFAWVGFGGDIAWYLMTSRPGTPGPAAGAGPSPHTIPLLGIFATLVAGGICWYSWRSGADRVLWATGAKEVFEPTNEQEQRLINVVEEMAIAAGLPRPRIFVIPDPDPNAFATGITPDKACIAVTDGLLRTLNRDELQAVVAHEMAHVQNFDTRLMTLLAAMIGAIALMSDGMGRIVRYGNVTGRGGGEGRGKNGNPLAIVVLILWLLTLLIAPVVSRLLAMAVSRKREYLADATGATLTRNPLALASALEKLDQAAEPTRSITQGAAHLCIVDPSPSQLSDHEGLFGDIFASHPPIRLRIARLRGMGYQFAKQAGALPAQG